MLIRAQCSWQGKSGLAEDRFVNTFYFQNAVPDVADFGACATALRRFYTETNTNAGGAATAALIEYMSPTALKPTEQLTIKLYDMADPEPRSPMLTDISTITFPPIGTKKTMPYEVALCMSFKAVTQSGDTPARNRGRVYIGPIVHTAMGDEVLEMGRPNSALRQAIGGAGVRMRTEQLAVGNIWVVHSPTTGPLSAKPVVTIWCDDAWDTQRRRGLQPTLRETRTMASP